VNGSVEAQTDTAEGLARLHEAEYEGMVRLARLISGSPQTAEEVVHDAFITLFSRGGSINQPGAYQRRRRTERLKLETMATVNHDQVVLPPELDETWRALDRLSRRQRTALVLRYYEDLTIGSIAAAMDAQPGTVKSLLHRGLKRLEQELER